MVRKYLVNSLREQVFAEWVAVGFLAFKNWSDAEMCVMCWT